LDWGDISLGIIGLVALALGVLDFTPLVHLTDDPALQMVLSGIGLLLGAIVFQSARRRAEVGELQEALGLMEIEILDSKKAFPEHLLQSVLRVQKFILYSNLNREVIPGLDKGDKDYHPILYGRLKKRELGLRRVDTASSQDQLENLIRQILRHKGEDVYFRYYSSPPKSIPTLNIMSFDDERFYIGGFNPAESPTEGQVLYIRQPKMTQHLHDYWNVLWLKATPLNEGRVINWDELRRIANRIGMTDTEFDEMVERVKQGVG